MRQILEPDHLVLGAGNKINENAINHDKTNHRPEIDVVWNLNFLPWPFKDNSFVFIEASSVFEHLKINLLECMNECWRIMKPKGILFVKLNYWNSESGWEDPTHTRGYALKTMDWFDESTENGKLYSFYTPYKWKILEKKINKERTSLHFTLKKERKKL